MIMTGCKYFKQTQTYLARRQRFGIADLSCWKKLPSTLTSLEAIGKTAGKLDLVRETYVCLGLDIYGTVEG